MVVADQVFVFSLHCFATFYSLHFVFLVPVHGCRKDPKTVPSLGSVYNSSFNSFYLFNKKKFRQVLGMETDTLYGIFNPPLTRGDLR